MRRRNIIALSVLVAIFLWSLAPELFAEVETRSVLSFTEEGLRVRVYAPYQAYPGDTIKVRVDADALEALADVTITIDIFGSRSKNGKEGYDKWEDGISVVDGVDWEEDEGKDKTYNVDIPSYSDPGLVYGHITCEWTTVTDDVDHTYAESFTITYVLNKAYEDLQEDYKDLSSKYDKLKVDYDGLSSTYNDLQKTYNSLRSDYDSLRATYEGLNSSYQSLQTDYKSLQADHSELSSKYDDLETRFSSLDSEHKSLLAEYDDLESRYEATVDELGTFKTYTYIFVLTTIVAIATTIIIALRRPRTV